MRVESKKLMRQMRDLPGEVRDEVAKVIRRGTEEGLRTARILAPAVTGETKAALTTEYSADGLRGTVVAVESDAPRDVKDKRYSIEHGRKKGERGTTEGFHHMHTARSYLAKKNKGRIRRAVNKAARRVVGG